MKSDQFNLRSLVSDTPPPIAGLALAIVSLGWCWENVLQLDNVLKHGSAILSTLLLIPLVIKYGLNGNRLLQDLSHPIIGSVMPTATMALMILSSSIRDFHYWLGECIWLVAVISHLLLMCGFIYFRLKQFSLEEMVPTWFIPPIGIVAADVSFSGSEVLKPLADYILLFGLFSYVLMLPAMLYRLIFLSRISENLMPTIAVLAAPASLTLAGYLTVTVHTHSLTLIALLFGIALTMTTTLYVSLFHILRLPFNPSLSATTFPLVIGATALYKLTNYLAHSGFEAIYINQILIVAHIELAVATGIVCYVAIRYLLAFRIGHTKYRFS